MKSGNKQAIAEDFGTIHLAHGVFLPPNDATIPENSELMKISLFKLVQSQAMS